MPSAGTLRTSLILFLLLGLSVSGFAQEAPATEAATPAEPAEPAEPAKEEATIRISADGSIEHPRSDKDATLVVTRHWQVNHESPGDLKKDLDRFLAGMSGDVVEVRPPNLLVITAPPEVWPLIEKLLEVIDIPEPQVYVEAKIIEIRYDTNLEFGVDMSYDRRKATGAAQPFFGKFTGAFSPETYLEGLGTSKPFQGGEFQFKTVGGRNVAEHGEYEYIVRALQERGSAEILSHPSILATQGRKAKITTGISYPVQKVDVKGTQSFVTTEFKDTGILLEITPELVGREYVTLVIKAEDSQITERVPGPEGSLNPVISKRGAETQVNVRDGDTVIIGGLLSTTKMESKRGLPFLSDIPILSYLFSSTRTREVKSELVFFIKPNIIRRREHTMILPPSERRRQKR